LGGALRMRGSIFAIMMALQALLFFAPVADVAHAADTLAQNYTEHSWVFVNGYMEESRILQTQTGYNGQKMVLGTSGSGIATRTIDSEVYRDSNEDSASIIISSNYDYHPYVPPLTQSDLKNASVPRTTRWAQLCPRHTRSTKTS